MQQVAKFVVRAMERLGASTLIYLDNLFIEAATETAAKTHYDGALELLTGLGLPIAQDKLQPPARELVCLGINIDLATNTISIPDPKLQEFARKAGFKYDRPTIPAVCAFIEYLAETYKSPKSVRSVLGCLRTHFRMAHECSQSPRNAGATYP